ncbi:MAG: dihydrolipoyl dehydrogenase [Planctomycetes bacterium RBG_13_44_8b]|nr:MAG: dihydrolipoyl dehydrogenase [Planctomycetes bacterium RBG_13_44_8b]
MAEKFDVVVIGAGPGGFRAAKRCAQKGEQVAIVEKEFIGGTCLNWGCIPSKSLLAAAHVLLTARQAGEIGIDIDSATPNWSKIQQRKDAIVTGFRKAMTGTAASHKIKMFAGTAIVTAPNNITVTNGTSTDIQTNKIILATGSESIELPNIPFDGQTVISSKEALSLPQIPKSILIIGGGVIGCEMACVYAAMGTKVYIVEALPRLLPMEDEWVGRLVEREFKKLGTDSITGVKVTSVDTSDSPAKVTLENGQTIGAEKILVSVGRRPAIDKEIIKVLNLKMNGPAIVINEKLETNVPGVYAIGDVVGTTLLAHGATTEADVAAANATGGNRKMTDYGLIPRVIFTFPEVASVGKSEEKCKAEGIEISVGKGFFKGNGRSVAHNETAGQVRVVRDNATNKIIGVTIVGFMATEFVTLARTLIGLGPDELSRITYPHPTISETIEDAVIDAFGNIF